MHLLRDRSFALLVCGQAISGIGSWAALVAIWGFAAYRFDAGPGDIALLAASWGIPAALLGPVAGVPIDRIGPRKVLVASQLLGAGAALALLTADSYRDLAVIGLLHGIAKAFSLPALDALPPRLVDDRDLLAANSLLGSAVQSSIVFGPLVAAAAIALWGLEGAFVVDACTYLAGVAVVLPLRLRAIEPRPRRRMLAELREGLRVASRSRGVRFTLLQAAAVYVTWSTYVVIEPLYVRDVLGRSPSFFAFRQAAFGVGLVASGLLLPRIGDRVATPRWLAGSVLLSGIAAAVYVGTELPVVAFVGVFLWGVDVAFFSIPSRTLLQRHAPVAAHGRVLALNQTLRGWADLVALPLAGLAAGAIGIQAAGLAAAGVALLAGAAGMAGAAAVGPPEPGVAPLEPAPAVAA